MNRTVSAPPVELRPVRPSDAEDLARIRVEAMRESLEAVGRFDAQRARDRFLGTFVADHTREIVASGQRVGFVVVRPLDDGLLLDHLYLLPAAQGRGLGGAVLAVLFADADAAGRPLRVGALKHSRSNQFYLRHGFRLIESAEWDNYYVRQPEGAATGEAR
ncbi:GNAT family N-acetyltransferase [Aquabacterium humicola]|uniref:GNAT family N-acetyltransferase n=1 Tax=Aquabacterium humicola TaxID=3237377 RepID=UPI002543EAA8|nr:GNAT family N-acetyltransferase [Rubrivivax pictus]